MIHDDENHSETLIKHCQRHNGPRKWPGVISLIAKLATSWSIDASGNILWPNLHLLQVAEFSTVIWPPIVTTWISSTFYQILPFGATCHLQVDTFATIWCLINFCHQVELLELIAKCGHQVAPLVLVLKLATRLRHCIATLLWIALLAVSVRIELVSSSARVTSVKSATR